VAYSGGDLFLFLACKRRAAAGPQTIAPRFEEIEAELASLGELRKPAGTHDVHSRRKRAQEDRPQLAPPRRRNAPAAAGRPAQARPRHRDNPRHCLGTAGRLRLDGLSRTRGQWSSVRPVTGCGAVIKVSPMTGAQRKALGSVSRVSSERVGRPLLFLAALASTPFHLLLDQRVKNLARHRF
jgi:hypothetical protein